MAKDYQAPEIQEVKNDVPLKVQTSAPVLEPVIPVVEPKQEPIKNLAQVVSVAELIDAESSAVSLVYKSALDRYFSIVGQKIYPKDGKYDQEQVAFMRTLENTLKLDFDQFAIVTDYLVKRISEQPELFTQTKRFLYLKYVEKIYSQQYMSRYMGYINALVLLATNAGHGKRLLTNLDLDTLVDGYPQKAATNINSYITRATKY